MTKKKANSKNELVEHKAAPVSTTEQPNYFELYGEQAAQRPIVGRLLKFNKGDWLAGQEQDDIPSGTKFIVHMDTLSVGWTKWAGDRPERTVSGLVIEGYVAPRRADLGDLDEALWELSDDGRPRDPWVLGNQVVLRSVDDPADLYTLVFSSKGGIGAIGELCKAYGKESRIRPDEFPVIELATSFYNHSSYGRIKTPILTIVGWAPKEPQEQKKARKSPGKASSCQLKDDTIPF